MPSSSDHNADYVVPAHMANADVWTRIEWLVNDMRDDDLNSGVPRYQPRYTQREQEICHLLGFGYKALSEAIDRHDAEREQGRCDAPIAISIEAHNDGYGAANE